MELPNEQQKHFHEWNQALQGQLLAQLGVHENLLALLISGPRNRS